MNRLCSYAFVLAVGLLLLFSGSKARAVALLTPGDPMLAIDLDAVLTCASGSPSAEEVYNILDNSTNKYLNWGGANSGFIATLDFLGAQTVTSFQITTANDVEGRDPLTWALYGTNDPIASLDDSFGTAESWTMIDSGTLSLPIARNTLGDVVSVNNSSAYASYKMLFPTLKDSSVTMMQVAEVSLFSNENPGVNCMNLTDSLLAIDADEVWSGSGYPTGTEYYTEDPAKCIDGIVGTDPSSEETKGTKYLNWGGENSGFIVTPSIGKSMVTSFQITTANDVESRDPLTWALYGTNDVITSVDNSDGSEESWTLIAEGGVVLPGDRLTAGEVVAVENSTYYTSYRMVFPTLKDASTDGLMQIEEIQFYGTIEGSVTDHAGDANRDGKVDDLDASILAANWQRTGDATWETADFNDDGSVNDLDASILAANWQYGVGSAVPEPGTLVLLAGLALLGLARWARRK